MLPRTDLPELRELRKSNILPNTHASIFGLANWLLKQNVVDTDIDPLRIQIKRAFLPTTAEGLLLSLASRNLVLHCRPHHILKEPATTLMSGG